MAKLLSRSAHRDKAEGFWRRFFAALTVNPAPPFVAEGPGALIHAYIANQLHAGAEPKHLDVIIQHRQAVIAHHQHLLEYATSDAQLDRMEVIEKWMENHFYDEPRSSSSK